ncbi:hypothetical protein ATPR_1379 [Acetobacter tropicalis NBRC 101654]|uniref:Transposase n=1 Tax=Acetobacter tropicalis NBRC 101654 TaxID=749388 RepID=F7VDD0_9PROT|nr:hypothetical protein ATPR_1379 [Acetobacter tropicalis NBRC 101654]
MQRSVARYKNATDKQNDHKRVTIITAVYYYIRKRSWTAELLLI